MNEVVAEAYRRFLVRWVDLVRRWAFSVVFVSVIASVGAVYYLTNNISINTSTTDMLSPELQFRRDSAEINVAFPQFSDNILVVIEGETPDLADDAALALAARLRQYPELFGDVHDIAGDPFFRNNGLLFLNDGELNELSDRLAEAQPFLGALGRDASLRGLFRMLELVIDEFLKNGGKAPMEMGTLLNSIADVAEKQAAGRFSGLSWHDLMRGKTSAKKDKRRFLMIQPALNFSTLQPAAKAMKALRSHAREMSLDEQHGVKVRLTGSAALGHEEMMSVQEGMGLASLLSLFLVGGLLMIGLRSPRLLTAILVTLIMGLIWNAAFAIAAFGQLNLLSVAFAVLFIGLSDEFGVHLALRYKEEIDNGLSHAEAIRHAAAGGGGALTLCAVSAAIAFYSFLPTDYRGLAELGLIAGTGMFIALFANITILPAVLTLLPLSPGPKTNDSEETGDAGWFSYDRAKSIAWAALVLGLAAATLAPKARFDSDPLNLKDPNSESVATLFDLMDDSRTSPYSITILANNLDMAEELAAKLDVLGEVDSTETLADYVPKGQGKKLEIIGDMALFLAPSLSAKEQKAAPTAEERAQSLASLRAKLKLLSGGEHAAGARRLDIAFSGLVKETADGGKALKELEARLLSGLAGRLRVLRESLAAKAIAVEDLPATLRSHQIAADGRARLKVYPKENLQDEKALRRFVDAVRSIAPHSTGMPVVILEAGNTVIFAFWQATLLAIGGISLMLLWLLRAVRDSLLVFAPLALASLLTVALSVLFNIPFNLANIIALPLLFGLGVASGIHLVAREREEAGSAAALMTSTPRAVLFSALTTIGSFGTMALSGHPGTASMGVLLTITITLSLVCTLFVLPALMVIWPTVRNNRKK